MNTHHSENIAELSKALSKASAEIKHALKSSENPFFKSNYADLKSITEACRPALAKNGLAVTQVIDNEGGMLTLITILMHESGQWIKSFYPITYEKTNPQAIGSGVTYARRYSLAAIAGVVTEDDDGEAAMKREPEVKPAAKPANAKKQIIDKLQACKTIAEIQAIVEDLPGETKTEKFLSYISQLESKLTEKAIKETFNAEESDNA